MAAGHLGECPGGIGQVVAGGDRDLQLPVSESRREFAQLASVRANVDVVDRDAALLGRRVGGDGGQVPSVGDGPDRAGRTAGYGADRGGRPVAVGERPDVLGPVLVVVVDDVACPQRADPPAGLTGPPSR